jgi:hypothetical protein
MDKLSRDDLFSLEKYAEIRSEFRSQVMAHKQNRRLAIGPNATLYFEDRLTVKYQIQEMLRIERIFESKAIDEELATYNPLIPDGKNWKATFMLEYAEVAERRQKLAELRDVESHLWLQVKDFDRIVPIYNEDLPRSTDLKTSAVHFMRFELTDGMVNALCTGTSLAAGINHIAYKHEVDPVDNLILGALIKDLD